MKMLIYQGLWGEWPSPRLRPTFTPSLYIFSRAKNQI
nr:MAG TPA: hypothetical protein [Caudoviricetes sp.]